MVGCATRCTTFSKDSIESAWTDIRYHFGPRVDWSTEPGTIAYVDVATWTEWANVNGVSPTDVTRFGKWLIWYLSYGTTEYGNLPTRKRDHEGISCIPCPYDVQSDEHRTALWLELGEADPLPTQSDHSDYYMRVARRGNVWGFECTDPNCPYRIDNGRAYFHA